MFYGNIVAFDEGLAGDDTVLAAAVWRNLLSHMGTAQDAAAVVAYIRREMLALDRASLDDLFSGRVSFSRALRYDELSHGLPISRPTA